MGEAGGGQMLAGALAQALVAAGIGEEAEAVPLPRLHGERDIVEHAEIRQQLVDLEGAGKAAADALRRRQRVDRLALQPDLTGIVAELAEELGQQRGLACAVGADQRMDLTFDDVEIDAVGGDEAAEALA